MFEAVKALAALIALGVAGAASAQNTPEMPMEALALVHERQGEVHGCGVRLTGGDAKPVASAWFDVSFNVFRRGVGLAQSFVYEMKRSGHEGEGRPARVPVQSTWLKAADEASARLGENTERRDSLVYTLLIDDVLSLFEAVGRGRPVMLGIRQWGQRVDAVYSGVPVIGDGAREQITACLAALARE
jgi:hypothetical protein